MPHILDKDENTQYKILTFFLFALTFDTPV